MILAVADEENKARRSRAQSAVRREEVGATLDRF
jgi:hypothetical protein